MPTIAVWTRSAWFPDDWGDWRHPRLGLSWFVDLSTLIIAFDGVSGHTKWEKYWICMVMKEVQGPVPCHKWAESSTGGQLPENTYGAEPTCWRVDVHGFSHLPTIFSKELGAAFGSQKSGSKGTPTQRLGDCRGFFEILAAATHSA